MIEESENPPVPLHLRNAPTRLMKEMGYAKGYRHAHREPDAVTAMTCLPDALRDLQLYYPTEWGYEKKLQERRKFLAERRNEIRETAE